MFYIGFVPQIVAAGNHLVVTLKEDNTTLNDVVVIGYGVQKKSVVKAAVSYNASWGWASAAKKRDVTSATDYAILQNEFYVNGGSAPKYTDPYNLQDPNGNLITGFGTDWQSLIFNDNAPQQNHDISISGVSETVNYYLSAGYYEADGIVGSTFGQSNYDRLTLKKLQ